MWHIRTGSKWPRHGQQYSSTGARLQNQNCLCSLKPRAARRRAHLQVQPVHGREHLLVGSCCCRRTPPACRTPERCPRLRPPRTPRVPPGTTGSAGSRRGLTAPCPRPRQQARGLRGQRLPTESVTRDREEREGEGDGEIVVDAGGRAPTAGLELDQPEAARPALHRFQTLQLLHERRVARRDRVLPAPRRPASTS